MRKIYSLVLIAAGLLIGTQGWAQEVTYPNVCQIGTDGYTTVQKAIEAVPANNVQKTITLISDIMSDDESIENPPLNWSGKYINIPAGKNILLDLNGHTISGKTNSGDDTYLIFINHGDNTKGINNASLTIIDSKPNGQKGALIYERTIAKNGGTGELICNTGDLLIKDGRFIVNTQKDVTSIGDRKVPDGCYCVDNLTQSGSNCVATTTIEGGYFYNTWDCVRSYVQSGLSIPSVVNILGGTFEGDKGVVFLQVTENKPAEVHISDGNFTSNTNPLVRVYTSDADQMNQVTVSISGGTCNKDALYIQCTAFQQDKNSGQSLAEQVKQFEEDCKNMIQVTGGTFASENFQVVSTILEGKTPKEGGGYETSYSVVIDEDGQPKADIRSYTLPTLIDGLQFRDSTHNPETDDKTITVIPLWAADIEPEDGKFTDVQKPTSSLTITDDVIFVGDNSLYSILVKSGADVTVAKGTVLNVGDGGVTVENGGKIIVEAGGILKVGAHGFEGSGADALVVKSDLEASGIVAISPMAFLQETMNPALTVQMKTRACKTDAGYVYQYFAIPTAGSSLIIPTGVNTYMFNWNVANQSWTQLTQTAQVSEAFRGYILTNNAATNGAEYKMKGQIYGRDDASLVLNPGTNGALEEDELLKDWNFFGNSYLAPINLATFFADMSTKYGGDIEQTVYVYNGDDKVFKGVTPTDLEDFQVIPPMNAFFMKLGKDVTEPKGITIDYSECVWGCDEIMAMYTPARSGKQVLRIVVEGNEQKDKVSFFENDNFSADFDNGADATKLMNDGMNLYAKSNDMRLAKLATDNLDGVSMNFKANDAVSYTMTFVNSMNDNYVLVDNLTNAQVAMTDGATYTFVATPNETTENRFEIRKAGGVVTNLAEMKAAHAVKGIYTAAGQYVGKADRWNTLPAGMYIVDGVRMAK